MGYLHGSDDAEQGRLEAQAWYLGGIDFLPPLHAGLRVLDVGCGTGAIAREVASRVAPATVVGIDRHAAQVQTARRLAVADGIDNLRSSAATPARSRWRTRRSTPSTRAAPGPTTGCSPPAPRSAGSTAAGPPAASSAMPRSPSRAANLQAIQTPDGVIHLVSSRLHYRFNSAWLKTPTPAAE